MQVGNDAYSIPDRTAKTCDAAIISPSLKKENVKMYLVVFVEDYTCISYCRVFQDYEDAKRNFIDIAMEVTFSNTELKAFDAENSEELEEKVDEGFLAIKDDSWLQLKKAEFV